MKTGEKVVFGIATAAVLSLIVIVASKVEAEPAPPIIWQPINLQWVEA